jgi:hypothetical protein
MCFKPVRLSLRLRLVALPCLLVFAVMPVQAETIRWRVENPFRFFADADVLEPHRAALAAQGRSTSAAPVLSAERWLSARYPNGWAETAFSKTCWNLMRQTHSECGDLRSYVFPKSHRIVANLDKVSGALSCEWRIRARGLQRMRAQRQTVSCDRPVTFDVPYPAGASLEVRIGGRVEAKTEVRPTDTLIVGLGDSYASGDGNPDRPVIWDDKRTASFGKMPRGGRLDGYPARKSTTMTYKGRSLKGPSAFWLSQPCHRSLYSNQLRIALQLSLEDPHRSVTFLGFACSGASVAEGLLGGYKGVEPFPFTPERSQIGAVAVAQCGGRGLETRSYSSSYNVGGKVPALDGLVLERCPPRRARKIDLVLLSVGGNDVGFAKLLAYAILKDKTPLRGFGRVTESVYSPQNSRDLFPELRTRLKLLKRALHTHLHIPWDEADRVILTAYPKLAVERNGRSVCRSTTAGLDAFSGYELDRRRAREAEAVASSLTQLMAKASDDLGWGFVSEHRQKFAGRGVCAGTVNDGGDTLNELLLPRFQNGRWSPFPPSAYRGYASRQRWIRTANDSFLLAHLKVTTDLKRRFFRRRGLGLNDLMEASTFGGAFHPTAEGQAAIADAVLPVARRVLGKYHSPGR